MKADQAITDDGRTFHIGNRAGELAPYCLITGDPGRVENVVHASRKPDSPDDFKFFENPKKVSMRL
ncbi:MAG: hypothetical protein A3F54_00040 [Candidatus Kerfeldbacteria bacterium RIFCSPHIGHO2_12_FULL_48_17]|uniref:Uridine phosphorylase n=1 Tax=Candidatus Kerfeldbacteria bacterium RIFCSPHIGHO2_12_FULL_48_17 TaxID=1798542 RepID=A0A1G2B7T1_9BACT|nr:MAG: hypothetical protein A3F54_00040 [Candidatus Kerfeldbacteria bacterium RIFCSPHIGHO2_12_FULL_48_17]